LSLSSSMPTRVNRRWETRLHRANLLWKIAALLSLSHAAFESGL
jgi:hypothetical protein